MTATARGPYRKGIERRREIVTAAVDIFGRRGFRGATLKLIAETIGVTPAAVLKLFGSKEQLLIDVLQHWEAVTGEVMGPVRSLDSLRALMRYHVEHRGLLELYITMAAEAISPDHPAHELMRARYRRAQRELAEAFAAAAEQGTIGPLSPEQARREGEYLLAIMDGLEIQWLLHSRFDLLTAFNTYLDDTIARLRPTARKRRAERK